jgi:pyruvate kinase
MLGPHVIHKKAGGQVLPFSFSSGLPRLASSAHHLRRVLCTLMAASAGAATISFPYLMASASGACRHGTALRICATTGTGEAAMDVVSEAELREKGFMGMGKTKLVCTVGPACLEALPALAHGGMGVARVNLCHGGREWHRAAMRAVQKLNEEEGFCVSLMVDTEGSQLLVADHGGATSVKAEVGRSWPLCSCPLVELLHFCQLAPV